MKRFISLGLIVFAVGTASAQDNSSGPAAPSTPIPQSGGRGGAMQACRADVEKLCSGMRPGDGKLGQCIRSNHDQLSAGCRDALKSMRGQGGKRRR